jgi:hypothetical protein
MAAYRLQSASLIPMEKKSTRSSASFRRDFAGPDLLFVTVTSVMDGRFLENNGFYEILKI